MNTAALLALAAAPLTRSFGYRPLIDPIDQLLPSVESWWYALLLPCSFLVALTYRALRAKHIDRFYWRSVGVMTTQIVLGMIGLSIAVALFVQVLLPLLAPMPGS